MLGVPRLWVTPEALGAAIAETMVLFFLQFFRKHLTPEERADVILVLMEAVASASENDVSAASKILRVVLGSSVPDIGQVAAPRAWVALPFCSVQDHCRWGLRELQSLNPEEKKVQWRGFFLCVRGLLWEG